MAMVLVDEQAPTKMQAHHDAFFSPPCLLTSCAQAHRAGKNSSSSLRPEPSARRQPACEISVRSCLICFDVPSIGALSTVTRHLHHLLNLGSQVRPSEVA
ncbi:hypothetical protein BRADI_4g07085v3 [Brachypodium distachyon]|uniref:Uncharacterized protein n=1 Tax=Brachypodium distachyon TaxID=15368 RepID=A0A2K2CKX6_BRADI|nr:hypothetical protein BRADI_4g07085v3 [Brachypodium distachyon]